MKRDVYDINQRAYRVEFACRVILAGRSTSRKFDTCFEMGDGNEVAAAIYRRALKNPTLMEALPRYINVELAKQNYAQIYQAF